MLNKKISVGIIGLGKIGLTYDLNSKKKLTYSKILFKNKLFKLDFGSDLNEINTNRFKKIYKAESFLKYEEALKFYRSELIVICTNTEFHYSVFKKVISVYSPKGIIFEKPFTNNYILAKKIYEICKKKKIKIFINYIRTINPIFQKIKKKYLSDNKKKFHFNFYYPGEFINNGSHFVDLMIFLKGQPQNFTIIRRYEKFLDVKFSYELGNVFIRNTKFHKKKT